MSDVLIKGMEMPERCDNCPFHVRNHGEGFYSCVITGHFPIPIGDTERSCECVLKELPPHGRLIDADALLILLNHCMFPSDMVTTTALSMAVNWIKEAPTIIEAEEGE